MVGKSDRSREFWDNKARENPYWYASSYVDYDRPNLEEFWASGFKIWADLKAATGYKPESTHTVVEIGCGVGRVTRAIAPEVHSVLAFDISDEMLALAKVGAPANVRFQPCGDDLLAAISDGSADAVIAYCVLQHLPSLGALGAYLREFARVAKQSGLIAFTTTPRTWKDWPLVNLTLRARRRLLESLRSGGPLGLYHREWYGIRPSYGVVARLAPIALQSTLLHGDKWLFYGRIAGQAPACGTALSAGSRNA